MRFQFSESPEQEVKAMSYVNTLRSMNPNATEFNHLIQLFAAVHDNSCLYVISQFCRYVRPLLCLCLCPPACLPLLMCQYLHVQLLSLSLRQVNAMTSPIFLYFSIVAFTKNMFSSLIHTNTLKIPPPLPLSLLRSGGSLQSIIAAHHPQGAPEYLAKKWFAQIVAGTLL
jgi:hypothetical protein